MLVNGGVDSVIYAGSRGTNLVSRLIYYYQIYGFDSHSLLWILLYKGTH